MSWSFRSSNPGKLNTITRCGMLANIRRHFRLLLGAPICAILLVMACFSGQLSPADPLKINPGNILESPSRENLLGTDQLGRDILSRIIYASRISLGMAVASVFMAGLVGVILGLIMGYAGGWPENVGMRLIDIFVCIPEIFVAIVVIAFVGSGPWTIIFTIGFIYFPQFARVIYAVTSSLKKREYVLAAVSLGADWPHILFCEITPNIISVVIVQVSFTVSFAMLLEAGLSFLGMGIMPPQPSWGQMVGELKNFIFINLLPVIFPSIALFLAILSINLIGEWLQDWLNPGM